jgi:hypothetical protein
MIQEIMEVYETTTNISSGVTRIADAKDSSQKVSSILFSVDKREIKVSYLPEPDTISFSTLIFNVPELNEKGQVEIFTMDMVKIEKASLFIMILKTQDDSIS